MTVQRLIACLVAVLMVLPAVAQDPGGRGGRGGRGFGGMPRNEKQKLVKQFDLDGSGILDREERSAARKFLKEEREKAAAEREARRGGRGGRRGGRGFGGRGFGGRGGPEKPKLDPYEVSKKQATVAPDKPLYDLSVVRTIYLDFAEKDWSEQMADFYRTDIEVPATLTLDGKSYEGVGVRYRGNSSYFSLGDAKKKSMNVSVDMTHDGQNVGGYRTLNLLNGHADPSFMRTVLFAKIAGNYVAAAKASFVHLVVNGESWGLYINDQQLNRDFLKENFGTSEGTRWKIPPTFGGEGALTDLGDDVDRYKRFYHIKTRDDDKAWERLVLLCKTLNETPPEKLEAELPKYLDVEQTLWFLALDNVFMDGDGYHTRGSDYALYLDPEGRFRPLFHDNNETFNYGGGPGGFGRRGGRRGAPPPPGGARGEPGARGDRGARGERGDRGGRGERGDRGGRGGRGGFGRRTASLDPLAQVDETGAALVHRMMKVPAWRDRYLANVQTLLDDWLDWKKIGPLVSEWRKMIEPLVEKDDKAIYGHPAFVSALGEGSGRTPGLEKFVNERREFLVNHELFKQQQKKKKGAND